MRYCLYCKKELIGYHFHSRYCNNDCKNGYRRIKYNLLKNIFKEKLQSNDIICQTCGNKFTPKRKSTILKLIKLSTLTIRQWLEVLEYFNNSCAYCGIHKNSIEIHQDHVIPLSKYGEFTHNNIIPACRNCNINKSDNDMYIWYRAQPFYSQFREKKIFNWLGYVDKSIQQLSII